MKQPQNFDELVDFMTWSVIENMTRGGALRSAIYQVCDGSIRWSLQNPRNTGDASAVIAELEAALARYVAEDEVSEGMPGNEPWVETKRQGEAALKAARPWIS